MRLILKRVIRRVAYSALAEYFRSCDLPELCVGVWCNQDYALAEMWGGRLERSGTLASGAECCDFRFARRKRFQEGSGEIAQWSAR